MKAILLFFVCFATTYSAYATDVDSSIITFTTEYESEDLTDILMFQGMEMHKMRLSAPDLADKRFKIIATSYWEGKAPETNTLFDSGTMPYEHMQTIGDTTLLIKAIAQEKDGQLDIMFRLTNMSFRHSMKIMDTDNYVLKNMPDEGGIGIRYGSPFYLLAYIQPYDLGNGMMSWCAVAANGANIENWGEKFGIPHYVTFQVELY